VLIINALRVERPFCHHFAVIQNPKNSFSPHFILSAVAILFSSLEPRKPTGKQSQLRETNLCDNSMAIQLSTSFF
jgi:hypothetical protein